MYTQHPHIQFRLNLLRLGGWCTYANLMKRGSYIGKYIFFLLSSRTSMRTYNLSVFDFRKKFSLLSPHLLYLPVFRVTVLEERGVL